MYTYEIICIALFVAKVEGSGSFNDITGKHELGRVAGVVAAQGDWNSDHDVDVFVADRDKVSIFSGDGFGVMEEIVLPSNSCVVANIIAGDMNHDGLMDVLLQYSNKNDTTQYLQNTIYLQMHGDEPMEQIELPRSASHFLAVNMFGRLFIDFVGTLVVENNGVFEERAGIIRNDGCKDEQMDCIPKFECLLNTTGLSPNPVLHGCNWVNSSSKFNQTFPLETPFSKLGDSSITDLNGDCSGDVVFSFAATGSYRTLRFLQADPNRGLPFRPADIPSISVASEVGFISWYDVDQDGDMDMVAPYCSMSSCRENGVNIYDSVISIKNLQPNPGSSCSRREFSFPDVSSPAAIAKEAAASPDKIVLTKLGGYMKDTIYDGDVYGAGSVFPAVVRFGDVENDGHVDVILTVNSVNGDKPVTEMWVGTGDGGFNIMGSAANAITRVPDTRAGFFHDLDKDGVLDVMLLSVSNGEEKIHVLENNIKKTNHLFFKPVGLNGKCFRHCSTVPHNPDPGPYGVNMPGVSHKIYFKVPRSWSSRSVYSQALQLSQSQFLSLQNPFSLFGLGSTNSYIETYSCGYHIAGVGGAYHEWPQLLPNSEVIVINHPMLHPSDWTIEMYIKPSKYVKWIIMMTCLTLFALAVPIAVLRYKELKEDALERLLDRPIMPM